MVGIELDAPGLIVDMAATLFAKTIASLFDKFFDKAKANAPLKASPAPVVSITWSFNSKASTK